MTSHEITRTTRSAALLLASALLSFALLGSAPHACAQDDDIDLDELELDDLPLGDEAGDAADNVKEKIITPDPLEPLNRALFAVNDKLYFWLLKPVSKTYGDLVPQAARQGINNAFSNLATPVRAANCVLQGDIEGAGIETIRFVVNSTAGVAGIGDPAADDFGLKKRDEDLGQTLGSYGFADGPYLVLPFFGPSNLRDAVGRAGDSFLHPYSFTDIDDEIEIGLRAEDTVNDTSLRIGDYERFKDMSLDPYVAIREAYTKRRHKLIRDRGDEN